MTNHFTLTLNGSAQLLSSGISGLGNSVAKVLMLQAAPANAAVIYVGGAQRTLTNADYGAIIPIPVTTIPAAPLVIGPELGLVSLAEIQVLGANNEKLHVLMVT